MSGCHKPLECQCSKCYCRAYNLNDRLSELEKLAESQIENDHKTLAYHIINLRDACKRIEQLEQANKNINDTLEFYHNEFKEKIKKLDDKNNISCDESRFKLLEMRIDNLREDINLLLQLLCDPNSIIGRPSNFKLKEEFNKKPHKCPICEGSGKYKIWPPHPMNNYNTVNCFSCNQKGIVWG